MHTPDYLDAHRRHWEDAELLYDHQRWANSDQLYGLSSECGLKAVMKVQVDTSGRPQNRQHRAHIDQFWHVYVTSVEGRAGARILSSISDENPFADWSIHDRYANRIHIAKEYLEPHRDAARKIRTIVQLALQDGRL